MTDIAIRTMAMGAALSLLLFAPTSASAHKAHEDAAKEAAKSASLHETHAPVAPAPREIAENPATKQHDHSNHALTVGNEVEENDVEPTEAGARESNVPKLLAWLGKFHPPLTHFPIALLAAAALAELLFMRTGKVQYDHAARFSVWLGAGAALATAPLGWFFAGFQFVDDEWVMTAHRWFGTATALWAGVLLFVSTQLTRSDELRGRFRSVLFAGAALVTITGFLGGSLLYGIDHYAW